MNQATLKDKVVIKGIGLHTGEETSVVLKPADIDHGIKFVRTDLIEKPRINAIVTNVVEVEREVVLEENGVRVHTVEHLLSSLSGLEIDNVLIEVDGPEIPILDGSSKLIVEAILEVGIKEQFKPKKIYRIREPISISKEGTMIILLPSTELKISCTIEFGHKLLDAQYMSTKINRDIFVNDICGARTFCLEKDIEYLREKNLIKGGSLDNAVVIGKDKIINEEGLRYNNEFVRHKILDLLGDFSLLGAKICAHIIAIRTGHETNISIVNKVYQLYKKTYSGMKNFLNINENDDMLDITRIKDIIPHRYPMLLVDRIIGIDGEKKIIGLKNVSVNEEFFQGHWPERPVMPGVLIIEAMAQLAGVMLLRKVENSGKLPYFMGLDKVKWRNPVVPGDQLILEVDTIKVGTRRGLLKGHAYVEGKLVCEGEYKFTLV